MDAPRVADQLRQQLPAAEKLAYFDHAAVAPIPAQTAVAMNHYVEQALYWGDLHWQDWAAGVERARTSAAKLIGAQPHEIAMMSNTTAGISVIAEGFPWQPGDNVVVPINEFPSNLVPWRNLAQRGVQLKLVEVGLDGSLTPEMLESQIDAKTKLVAISWVGFSSGFRCDLDGISQMVHSHGCSLLLDAIQGLGAFPIDVKKLGIDFLASDGHKWMLGPEGAALLYIDSRHLDRLRPLGVGWNSLAGGCFDPGSTQLKHSAARYEGGSTCMVSMLGLGASLELLLELGSHWPESQLAQAVLSNVDHLTRELTAAGFQVEVPSCAENRSGIIGVRWPEADLAGETAYLRARKHLLSHKVAVSVRGGRVRVATHAYNNAQDRERLINGLQEFRHGT
jgi:selenocysteine lyase/cysteine desulfurase